MKKKIILLTAIITLLMCSTIGNAAVVNNTKAETNDEDYADVTIKMSITAKNLTQRTVKAEIESYEVNDDDHKIGKKIKIDLTVDLDIGKLSKPSTERRMRIDWRYYVEFIGGLNNGDREEVMDSYTTEGSGGSRVETTSYTIELELQEDATCARLHTVIAIDRYIEEEYNSETGEWETICHLHYYDEGLSEIKDDVFTISKAKVNPVNYQLRILSKFPVIAKLLEQSIFARLLKNL